MFYPCMCTYISYWCVCPNLGQRDHHKDCRLLDSNRQKQWRRQWWIRVQISHLRKEFHQFQSRLCRTDLKGADKREPTFVFVGPKGCGKSTLIKSFMSKGAAVENTKPTACLDYKFTRVNAPNSTEPVLSHIWEVGTSDIMCVYVYVCVCGTVANVSLLFQAVAERCRPYCRLLWIHELYPIQS